MKSGNLWRALDVIVGGLFIWAGVLKVIDPAQFARDIDNYKMLPWDFSLRLAFYLPWLEILCGLALVVRRLYDGGLSILFALISIFIAATIVARARGLDITCGCFGHAMKNLGFTWHLLIDLAIFAVVLALWIKHSSSTQRRQESV